MISILFIYYPLSLFLAVSYCSFLLSIPLFLDIHAYTCLYSCLFVCLFVRLSITHSLSDFIFPHEMSFILGTAMGDDPRTGRPVMVRSGRFGRYMQIGLDSEKNKTTHSLPQVINLTKIDLFWLILMSFILTYFVALYFVLKSFVLSLFHLLHSGWRIPRR